VAFMLPGIVVMTALSAAILPRGMASRGMGLGLLMGVRLATGLPGLVAVLLLSGLFALAMAGFSLALAAVLRTHEALMAAINLFTLPLIFTGDAMFPRGAMPRWLAAIPRINPVSWAVGPVRDLVLHG